METENNTLYKYSENTIKKLNYDLWSKITNYTTSDITFKEKFYLYENNIGELPKCECGCYVKFVDMRTGYRTFCSKKCLATSKYTKEKKIKTNLEKWGVENPSQNNEIRKKVKETNLQKFGVEYPLQSKEILEKLKRTNLENWGVENPSMLRSVREKAEQTNLVKFGVRHAAQNKEVKENLKRYLLEKFGVENISFLDEFREKAEQTNLQKFGFKHALKNPLLSEKLKKSNLEKWGVEFYPKTKEYKEKSKKTSLEKWGETNYSKTEECKKKTISKNLEKWGVTNYAKTEECKNKIKKTNLDKYNSSSIFQNEVYRKNTYKIAQDEFYLYYFERGDSIFNCDCGGIHQFQINIDNYITRKKYGTPLCTVCYPIGDNKSIKEKEVYQFLKTIYSGEIIQSYKEKLEIDIYLPDLKLGFEFNGLYWHSNKFLVSSYHSDKTDYFKNKGIKIIHIWEDVWTTKKDILKSQIKNWIGSTERKIYARKCNIKEVLDFDFLDKNHIQGKCNSVLKLGLYNNNELVSLMTFDQFEGRKKMKLGEWNLNRFCNKLNVNVVGGASKLLQYFIANYSPSRIISYADKDWSTGHLYENIGFVKLYETKPDYKYIVSNKRVHKSNFRKSKTGISEKSLDLVKVYDCGKIKFEIIL